MKSRMKFIATLIALVVGFVASAVQVYSQHHDHVIIGKTGMLRLSSVTKVGDHLLKPGMYHVQHVVEASDHFVVFKPVTMPAGYREYSMVEGGEIVRLKCRIESVVKSVSNTKVTFGRNPAGEQVIDSIQVPGEKAKHVFD